MIVSVEPSFGNYMLLLRNTRQFRNVIPVHAGLWPTVSTLGIMKGPRTPNALEWGFMVQKTSQVRKTAPNQSWEMRGLGLGFEEY